MERVSRARPGTVLKFSRRFAREHLLPLWRWYVAGVLAVLLTNFMSVAIPTEMAKALDAMRAGDMPTAATYALQICGLGLGVIGVRTASRIWFFTPARVAEFNLREQLFGHALELQPGFFTTMSTGDLLSRLTTDVTFARALAGFALLQLFNVVGSLVLGIGQMLRMSPLLTLVTIVPMVLAFAIMQMSTGKLMTMQRQAQVRLAALSDELLGTLQGVATVQGFNAEEVFTTRLLGHAAELRRLNLTMTRYRVVLFPLVTIAAGVAVFGLIEVGGPLALDGKLSPGQLAAFVSLVVFVIQPMRLIGWLVPVFQRAEASLERVYTVRDTAPERPDLPVRAPFPSAVGPTIELRDLRFAYPDAPDRPILDGLNARIPAGATVGIYGATGSGKTTLLRLFSRLRNPERGSLFIDGVDILDIDLRALREHLTLVPQSPFLFSELLRENVGLGASDAEVRAAVDAASLGPDLNALPDGLDTLVGERGITLSGGQRQRVALARGLVRPRPIVLLDDVLSAVDHRTEHELLTMLRGRKDATRVIVSHRLSAFEAVDLILVMADGRIVDQGTHLELIQRPGPYQDAWTIQREAAA